MFASNEQISWKQMYCQMVLGLLGALLLFLPGEGEIYGLPGTFAVTVAVLVLVVYCFLLVRIAPVYGHLARYVGISGMRVAGGVFLVYFILTGAFLISVIWEAVSIYINISAPQWVIHVAVILTCGMAGIPQIQRRGRLAELVFPFFILVLTAMIVMAFIQNRGEFTAYLMQRTYVDVDTIFIDVYKILAVCACVGATPFILSNVRDRRYVGLVSAVGTLFLFLVGTVVLLQGSYGIKQVMTRNWPVLSIMSSIRIPGGFVFRMDPIWIALMLLLLLFSVGSSFFYGNYIVKKTDLKIPWYVVYGLIYVASLTKIGEWSIRELYLPMVCFCFAPAIFLWNLFLGIRMRANRREKHHEK